MQSMHTHTHTYIHTYIHAYLRSLSSQNNPCVLEWTHVTAVVDLNTKTLNQRGQRSPQRRSVDGTSL